ncbi:hypothetical protein HanIR_Chr06g0261781 [Helianthus annuus]|nr:hypothetical protein HanIR_Chr06g0261781 [Helianthus annuus]
MNPNEEEVFWLMSSSANDENGSDRILSVLYEFVSIFSNIVNNNNNSSVLIVATLQDRKNKEGGLG